jgi:hypothetical protein
MIKILITAPFGGTFKNLLLNPGFLKKIENNFSEVHIITPISKKDYMMIISGNNFSSKFFFHSISIKDNYLEDVLIKICNYIHSKIVKTKTYNIKRNEKRKELILIRFLRILMVSFFSLLGFLFSWRVLFVFFVKLRDLILKNKIIDDKINSIKPDLIFSTAPSFKFDLKIITEIKKRSLLSVGMIYSWDNLSSKGAIFEGFKKVIVWNDFQLKEIQKLYPYKNKDIYVSGIPQLDYYCNFKNKKQIKINFFKKNNLNKNTKLITYTTSTPITVPSENKILEILVKTLGELDFNWHLIIRLHPKDDISHYKYFKRMDNVSIEYPSSICVKARDGVCFNKRDIIHYGEVLTCSDIIINIASTVSMEAVVINTPVVNIAFDEIYKDYHDSVRRFYDFDHMEYFKKTKSTKIVYSKKELKEAISSYIEKPGSDEFFRKKAMNKINPNFNGLAGIRIANFLKKCLNEKNKS